MNISLRLLRYVTAAAESGNVTEAARRLQVSQPSVSAAIAELEQMLGVTVFVRHHARGVTLTPAGQRLITEARLLLKHAEDFTKTAESLGDTVRGEITIGCFPALAARYMPSLMLEFTVAYPEITLRLEEGDQDKLIRDLAQGRIELALTYDVGLPGGFHMKPLLTLSPLVVLSAEHRLARSPDIVLSDLAAEPFIMYGETHFRQYFESIFSAVDITPNIALTLQSFELIRGLVARGHGYTIHTVEPLTNTTYDGGHVVMRSLRGKFPGIDVVCLTPSSHIVRPTVSRFAEFLQTALRRRPTSKASTFLTSAA